MYARALHTGKLTGVDRLWYEPELCLRFEGQWSWLGDGGQVSAQNDVDYGRGTYQ